MPRRSPRGKPYHKPQPRDPNVPRRQPRSTNAGEHRPVLLAEVIEHLALQPGQVAVDCTLGFAGHTREMVTKLGQTGRLIACDLDRSNLMRFQSQQSENHSIVSLHQGNFAGITRYLAQDGIEQVDAVLADLGVSSMQLDDPLRGFSMMRDGPLDMRMDPTRGQTAADLLATLSEEQLADAIRDLGDEPQAVAIAQAIVERRSSMPITRTSQLRALIDEAAPVKIMRGPTAPPERKQRLLPTTRVFQAIRILVNRELANLQHLLRTLPTVLKPGGRVVIISFHSGEDRLVKAAFKSEVYSARSVEPVRPGEEEIRSNPRSRSAKLRWARI